MAYHTVLFDLDYTLGDATGGILACFRHALCSMGYPDYPDDILRRTIGYTLEDSFSMVTGERSAEKREMFRSRYSRKADQIMERALRLFPDTLPMLRVLQEKGCQMAVVSTRPVARLEAMLTYTGARPFFRTLVGVDSIPRPKPDPGGLLEAMTRCGVGKEHTLYIGDTVVDAQAAARAEVDFAAVATGTTPREAFLPFHPRKVAGRLGEVLSWLEAEHLL
ncbi:MAG: HAD family hydrolase [Oscillospiraceae bacterium]|jgi:phosphoglycolate phosphatase